MNARRGFAGLLQAYFTDRLIGQCGASPNTIASYRDTFRLLLAFAHGDLKKSPAELDPQDVDAPFIGRFLDYLEKERGVTARSRNARLAAIHSFFHYTALQEPALGAIAQRVLAIQCKRCAKKPIDFLTPQETNALLAAPDQTTWSGRRDRTLLLLALQTGLRVSELIGLGCQDVTFGPGAHVRCTGKGRKTRCIPLHKETAKALRQWLRLRQGQPSDPLFPSARGQSLSRDGVDYLLAKHVNKAAAQCPALKTKHVSPHVLRHSTAMNLLQHGVDRFVIAMWLGHESIETTQVYLHASLELKEQALATLAPSKGHSGRYRPPDRLLAFLQSL